MGKIIRFAVIGAIIITLLGVGVRYLATGSFEGWQDAAWFGFKIAIGLMVAIVVSAALDHIFNGRR